MSNTLNGHRDTNLCGCGVWDAFCVSKKLRSCEYNPDIVFSSPLKRALHTAEIITNRNHYFAPVVLPELIERDFGVMSGRSVSEIRALCAPKLISTPHTNYFLEPELGETFPQVAKRAVRILRYLDYNHDKQNVMLVTHGDIAATIVSKYYEISWEKVLYDIHMTNTSALILAKHIAYEDCVL
jgi:broad specificity phosphatase PhoE